MEKFETKLILSKEIYKKVSPISKKESEKNYQEVSEKITSDIKNKIETISKLKADKTKTILTMLGQMYTGVIVPQELTVRRGEFYKYRCQWALDLNSVKKKMLDNLHLVSDKITNEKNLDILEYSLNIWDTEKDSDNQKTEKIKKDCLFDEICVLECEDYNSMPKTTSFSINFTNGLNVSNNGDIDFFYAYDDDGEKTVRNQTFQTENHNSLCSKFKDEIKNLSEEFVTELNKEIKSRTDELDEIKLKGSHLLMSAEIQKGNCI